MTPKALENRPSLPEDLEIYMTAFDDLSSDRPVGFGIGPIPWSSIARWGDLYGMDADEIADLAFILRRMEDALNELENKKERSPHG